MYYVAVIVTILVITAIFMVFSSIFLQRVHTPLSPQEEWDWLKSFGLSDMEVAEIMDIPPEQIYLFKED